MLPPGIDGRDQSAEMALAEAYSAMGPDYLPRGRHKEGDGRPRYVNRLIRESSPYLLQHAHNPVDWWPWCDEAFDEARRFDKPVFLSVGYSTCHWCHVMEEESFEDEEIARLLNTWFVSIKVDREEMPDVDAIYMSSVVALTGGGGWPMSVWLNHDREPFHGGTYYPPTDRFGRPGFVSVLDQIHEIWAKNRSAIDEHAKELSDVVRARLALPTGSAERVPSARSLHSATTHFKRVFDPKWGGFGGAPKFPRPDVLLMLLRYHRRTGDAEALQAVRRTLDAMSAGGIHDHIGGGFSRYAVDERWLVPHFEKMLYDNALLGRAYLEAHLVTGDERYSKVTSDILTYVLREMTSPEGAFWSATDADSEGEEGKFFVWSPEEIDAVVGQERGSLLRTWYGVTERGNFEGKTVLHTFRSPKEVADELGVEVQRLIETVDECRPLLYAARGSRVRPSLDDKVIASWNGLMISAFALAGAALDRPEWLRAATRAADFVLNNLRAEDGALLRTWRGGARHPGLLEDYAFVAAACLDLLEATGEVRWLDSAEHLQDKLQELFENPGGGWFQTPLGHRVPITRPQDVQDGVTPAGSSVATLNCLRLHALTGRKSHAEQAEGSLEAAAEILSRAPWATPMLLCALDWVLDDAKEIVVVQPAGTSGSDLARTLRSVYLPNAVRVVVTDGRQREALADRTSLVRERGAESSKPTAWVCSAGTCRAPIVDPMELRESLSVVRSLA